MKRVLTLVFCSLIAFSSTIDAKGGGSSGGGGGNYSNTLPIALTNSDRTTLSQLKARQRIVEKQQSGTNLSLTLTLTETYLNPDLIIIIIIIITLAVI